MFSVVSAYQKIYPKKLIPDDKALFYWVTEEQTPHSLVPEPMDVFEDYEPVKEILFPIIQLDLSALNPDFSDKITVLYHESTNLDYLIYQLDESGKIANLSFMDYKGNPVAMDDEEEVCPFEEGLEEVEAVAENLKGKYLKMIPTETLPDQIDYNDALAFSNEVIEIWKKAVKKWKPKTIDDFDYFGPLPSLVQFSPEYPVWNGEEDAFLFVGQVNMYELGLIGVSYFVFYHPESRTVAQLVQMT